MAIITAANVKSYMGIATATDTWDTEIGNLVTRIQALAEMYCDRKFEQDTYSYTGDDKDTDRAVYDGDGTNLLITKEWPIISVTTVRINETAIDESTSIYNTGWFIRSKEKGFIGLRGYNFSGGIQNIELTYSAGYATVPTDLVQALIEECAIKVREGPKDHQLGVSSIAAADGSIAMLTVEDLSAHTKMVLDSYARKVFA